MNNVLDYKIGIIGYGNFGKVVAKYLFPKNKIFVYSPHFKQDELHITVSKAESIQTLIESSDIIIPAVPIRQLEDIIKDISQYCKPDQIVMDVCSVKVYPVDLMKKYLQGKIQIIATHPMFGPNSIHQRNNSLNDLHLVIKNIDCQESTYNEIKNYFTSLELQVIEMSPEEHDKLSARSQFFAMMVGQIAQKLELTHTLVDTPGAAAIFDALRYMGPDLHIIEDMITYNVYCRTVLEQMTGTLEELKRQHV